MYKDDIKKLDLNWEERRLGYNLSNNPNRLMKDGIKTITIHQTGSPNYGGDADSHHRYQANNTGGRKVSWHYTIDEKGVIQSFRDNRVTWHSANSAGNESSLSAELCINADKRGGKIKGRKNYLKTIDNACKWSAVKMVQHGLTVKDLRQHFDWNGKNCPRQIREGLYGFTWQNFKDLTEKYYKQLTEPEKPAKQDPINGPHENADGVLWFRAIGGSYRTRESAEAEIEAMKKAGFKNVWLQAVRVKK